MNRKLSTDDDRIILKKFQGTYRLTIKSVDSFYRYKKARTFVINNFKVSTDRAIRTVIFKRSDELTSKIKDKYQNFGTQNYYLSSYKIMFDKSTFKNKPDVNPYTSHLNMVREEIREQPHPNVDAKKIREEVKGEHEKFTMGLWEVLDSKLNELNNWIKRTYPPVKNLHEFVQKYKRTFNNDSKLSPESFNINTPARQKFVNIARGILSISLQAGKNHILRAEHRNLRFYKYGGLSRQNFYSIRDKKIFINDYKTVAAHGLKIYSVRNLDVNLIKFIRVFTTSNYIFSTTKGDIVNAKTFGLYYSRIIPKMTPTKLRKILIDAAQKDFPETANSERTRSIYYTIADEPTKQDQN